MQITGNVESAVSVWLHFCDPICRWRFCRSGVKAISNGKVDNSGRQGNGWPSLAHALIPNRARACPAHQRDRREFAQAARARRGRRRRVIPGRSRSFWRSSRPCPARGTRAGQGRHCRGSGTGHGEWGSRGGERPKPFRRRVNVRGCSAQAPLSRGATMVSNACGFATRIWSISSSRTPRMRISGTISARM